MKQYITTALCSITFSVTFFFLNGMEELTDTTCKLDTERYNHNKIQQFLAAQELFSINSKGKQFFKLDIVEGFVRNYENPKPVETKIFLPDILLPEYPSKVYSHVSSLKELCAHTIVKNIDKYDFDNLPIGELENIFEYPGFSQAVKESIFKAVLEKSGPENLYRAISEKNNDYKTKMHSALAKFTSSGGIARELKEQINSYLIEVLSDKNRYDQQKSKELLRVIAFSDEKKLQNKIIELLLKDEKLIAKDKILKLENKFFSKKNEIFLHQVAVYSDGKRKPVDFLKDAINNFAVFGAVSPDYLFYKHVIDYCFKNYPLYTAERLTNLAITEVQLRSKEIALAIVRAHNLLQKTIDNNSKILQEAVKKAKCFELFLKYGIQPSFSQIIHEAVENGNFEMLKVLAEYDADFSDPAFMDNALKTKNLNCIHVMLNQQKNVLKEKPELFDSLADLISESNLSKSMEQICSDPNYYKYYQNKKYNLAYAKEVYKALLRAHVGNDIQPLKDVVFNFDADMQKLKNIFMKRYVLYDIVFRKFNDPANAIDETVDILFTSCALLKKYPSVLTYLINYIEECEEEKTRLGLSIMHKISNLDPQPLLLYPLRGIGFSIFLLSQSCENTSINNILTKAGIGIFILSALTLYPYFKKYNQEYYRLKEELCLEEKIADLKGSIRGLLGEKGEPIKDFQEEKCVRDVLNKWSILNMALLSIPFSYGFCPVLFFGPQISRLIFGLICGFCIYSCIFIESIKEGRQRKEVEREENTKKLFNYNFEYGKQKGYQKLLEGQSQSEFLQESIHGKSDLGITQKVKAIFGHCNLFNRFVSRIKNITWRNPKLQK